MLVSGTGAVRYAEILAALGADVDRPTRSGGRRDLPQAAAQRLLQRAGRRGGRGAYRRRGGRLRGLAARQHRRRAGRLRRAHDRPAGRRHPPARPAPGRRDGRREPSSCASSASSRASPGAARDLLIALRDGTTPHDHRLSRPLHDRAGRAHRLAGGPAGRVRGPASAPPPYPADLRRRDPRVDRGQPAAADGRARRRPHALLAARLGDGPPRRRRGGQRRVDAGPATTSSPAWSQLYPGPLRRRLPASAVARRADRPRGRPSCGAASRSSGSSAATSTPTPAAATGPRRR